MQSLLWHIDFKFQIIIAVLKWEVKMQHRDGKNVRIGIYTSKGGS